jgi:hypothetical protein
MRSDKHPDAEVRPLPLGSQNFSLFRANLQFVLGDPWQNSITPSAYTMATNKNIFNANDLEYLQWLAPIASVSAGDNVLQRWVDDEQELARRERAWTRRLNAEHLPAIQNAVYTRLRRTTSPSSHAPLPSLCNLEMTLASWWKWTTQPFQANDYLAQCHNCGV